MPTSGFNTKGITIEINGETTGLDKALRKVKQETQGIDNEMKKLNASIKNNDASFASFNSYVTLSASKMGNLQKQLGVLHAALETTANRFAEVSAKQGANSKEAQFLAQKLDYLRAEITLTEDKMDSLSKSVLDVTKSMSGMSQLLAKDGGSYQQLAVYQELASEKLKDLNAHLVDQTNELQLAERAGYDYSAANGAMGLSAEETARYVAYLKADIELTKAEIEELSKTCFDTAGSLDSVNNILQNSTGSVDAYQAKQGLLSTRIEEVNASLAKHQANLAESEAQYAAFGHTGAQAAGTLDLLKQQIDNQKAAIARDKAELQALNDVWTATGSNMESMSSAVSKVGATFQSMVLYEQNASKHADELRVKLEGLNDQLEAFGNGVHTEADQARILELRTEIERTTQEIEKCDKAFINIDNRLGSLSSALKQGGTSVDSFNAYQDMLKEKLNQAESALKKQEQTLKEAKQNYSDLSKQQGTSTKELEKASKAVKTANVDYQILKQEVKELSDKTLDCSTRMQSLNKALERGTTSISAYVAYQQQANARAKQLRDSIRDQTNTVKDAKDNLDRLKNSVGENSDEFKDAESVYKATKADLEALNLEYKELQQTLGSSHDGINVLEKSLSNVSLYADKAYKALKPISLISFAALGGATLQAINFESAWAGVLKTVEGTPTQLATVDAGLKELATSTASSYEEVAQFAELGGQMGVPIEQLLSFAKTITMLGDTTNIAGEEAAQAIAKIANVMVGAGKASSDWYERLGSVIVDLGNNFATTEADIVDMTTYLASAGRAVGMNEKEVLALSTALSSLGIKSAAGGAAMSKLMRQIQVAVSKGKVGVQELKDEFGMTDKQIQKAQDSLGAYAEYAGMTAEEFSKAWSQDAAGAFSKFLEGVGKSKDVALALEDLGIKDARAANATTALAQSSELFANALQTANGAWKENTAMADEANRRYGTLKSTFSQTKEAIKQAAEVIGRECVPYLKDLLTGVKNVAKSFTGMNSGTAKAVAKLLAFASALAPIAKLTSKASSGLQNMVNKQSKLEQSLAKVSAGEGKLSDKLQIATSGFGMAMGAVTLLTTAMAALSAISEVYIAKLEDERIANDAAYAVEVKRLGIVQERIANAQASNETAAQTIANYETEAATVAYVTDQIDQLLGKEQLSDTEKRIMTGLIEQLNELLPELGLKWDENSGALYTNTGEVIDNTSALQDNIDKQLEAAKVAAYNDVIKERTKALVESKLAMDEASGTIQRLTQYNNELSDRIVNSKDGVDQYGVSIYALEGEMRQNTKRINEAKDALGEAKTSYDEAKTSVDSLNNALSNSDLATDHLSESLTNGLDEAIQKFQDAGIAIPEALKTGIEDNAAGVQTAIAYQNSLINFDTARQEGLDAGTAIPARLTEGILAGCPNIESAILALNNLADFQVAVTNAGLSGRKIPEELAAAVANGTMSVGEAIQLLQANTSSNLNNNDFGAKKAGEKVGKDIGSGIQNSKDPENAAKSTATNATNTFGDNLKMSDKATEEIGKVASAYDGSGTPGSAGNMGGRETNAYSASLAIFSETQRQVNASLNLISNLRTEAATPITIKKVIETDTRSPAPRRMPLKTASLDVADVQPLMTTSTANYVSQNALSNESLAFKLNRQYSGALSDAINTRLNDFGKHLTTQTNSNANVERLLSKIATKDTVIVMSGKEVGRLTAREVAKTNNNYNQLQTLMNGTRG